MSGETTSTPGTPTTRTACCLSSTVTSLPDFRAGVGASTGGLPFLMAPICFSSRGSTLSFITSPEMHNTALEAQIMRSYCFLISSTVREERLCAVPAGELP